MLYCVYTKSKLSRKCVPKMWDFEMKRETELCEFVVKFIKLHLVSVCWVKPNSSFNIPKRSSSYGITFVTRGLLDFTMFNLSFTKAVVFNTKNKTLTNDLKYYRKSIMKRKNPISFDRSNVGKCTHTYFGSRAEKKNKKIKKKGKNILSHEIKLFRKIRIYIKINIYTFSTSSILR